MKSTLLGIAARVWFAGIVGLFCVALLFAGVISLVWIVTWLSAIEAIQYVVAAFFSLILFTFLSGIVYASFHKQTDRLFNKIFRTKGIDWDD